MTRHHLALITESYPFAGAPERPFIEAELAALVRRFDVTVVPLRLLGGDLRVVQGATVDLRAAMALDADHWWSSSFQAVRQRRAWSEAMRARLHPISVRRLVRHVRAAAVVEELLSSLLPDLVLTAWFDAGTTGALDSRPVHRSPVVTRAHGYDLYESRHPGGFIPLRTTAIDAIDRVLTVSEAGARYLAAEHPHAADRIRCLPLGTPDPGWVNVPNIDSVRRVVSCSSCVPVKRVDRIVRVVAAVARTAPGLQLSWTHLGGGPGLRSVRAEAERELASSRVPYELPGALPHEDVMAWLRDHRCDVFVNLSTSEGRPFAVMEAMSMGIPVLAGDVGGLPELVTDECGRLVPDGATIEATGAELAAMLSDSDRHRHAQRAAARARWEAMADADALAASFADEIETLSTATDRKRSQD